MTNKTTTPSPLLVVGLDRRVSRLTLRLVTYGLGNAFDPRKFEAVKNRKHTKPCGGLWASPVDCTYGWREWCESENWGDMSSRFETEYTGRTLVIDSADDLAKVMWINCHYKKYPDYEGMLKLGIDAIYLTERGERETRYTEPGLYGYDCECVVVLNGTCLKAANVELTGRAKTPTE